MGGESSGPTSQTVSGPPPGTETELLRIRGSWLYLIDGQESVFMQSGDLVLFLITQTWSPLAAVVALVGDLQWPIGVDSPVIRVGARQYSFGLPGLVYGLVLPETTSRENIRRLETLLQHYSTFQTHPEITAGLTDEQGPLLDQEESAAAFWTNLAADVESVVARINRQIRGGSTVASNSVVKGEIALAALSLQKGSSTVKNRSGWAAGLTKSLEASPRMMKRIQKARRMSAVAKLLSKTLMKGAITAAGHVAADLSVARITPAAGTISRKEVTVASVDAFAKVVEAVESAGKSLSEMSSFAGAHLSQTHERHDTLDNAICNSSWTLSREGLRVLFRATTASMAINVPGTRTFASYPPPVLSSSKGLITNSSSSVPFSSPSYLHIADTPVRPFETQFPSASRLHSNPTNPEQPFLGKVFPPPSASSSHAFVPSRRRPMPNINLPSSLNPDTPGPESLFCQSNQRAQRLYGYEYSSPQGKSENEEQ